MRQTRKRARQQTRAAPTAATASSDSDVEAETHTEWSQHRDSQTSTADHGEEHSESVDDEEDEDEVVLSQHFIGPTDAAGKLHGRGTLTLHVQQGRRRGRNVFTGSFSHGVKSGDGSWQFDAGSQSESSLSGSFVDDALEGEGRYVDSDGSYTVGHYKAGSLDGRVNEYTAGGHLLYSGEYRDNQRHGQGTLHHNDGGMFEGQWQHGLFHGTANTYTYPIVANKVIQFRGEWRDGGMHDTRLYVDNQAVGDTTYADDESTLGSPIANQPLLPDPYEHHTVYVAPSSLGPQAGEGLFARVDLPAGVCVSFYNGLKQTEAETERRHWRFNGNCIALDEAAGIDIDVPQHLATLGRYCASLGHKANHTFDKQRQNCEYQHKQNVHHINAALKRHITHCSYMTAFHIPYLLCSLRYWHFYHPRQGHIKCVRVRPDRVGGVKAGEELLVEYGYSLRGGPEWWKAGKRQWKAEEAARQQGQVRLSGVDTEQRQPTQHRRNRKRKT